MFGRKSTMEHVQELHAAGKWEELLEMSKKLSDQFWKAPPELYIMRSNAYYELGRYEDAVMEYRVQAIRTLTSLSKTPGSQNRAIWHGLLGDLYAKLERYDEALTCFFQAKELAPEDPAPLFAIGEVLHRMKQHDAAMRMLDNVITQWPGFARAHAAKGGILRDLGKLDIALQCCRLAMELDPNDEFVRTNYHTTLARVNQEATRAALDDES